MRSGASRLAVTGRWHRRRRRESADCRSLATEEPAQLLDRAHERGRKDDRGVLVDGDLDQGLEVAELQREWVRHHHVGGLGELAGGERLAFGGDDLGALL